VGQAQTAVPVLIHLKDPSWFPHHKQYPLKSEVEGLIPIIKDLTRQGLLIECSSPYNTPILSVRKGPNKWRLVQDLCLINEAVVPFHPVVPNPHTLLAHIPPGTTYYSVLDLKDAFFCIPLHPKSQSIFAFGDPTRKSGQVTWTVLPQGIQRQPPPLWVSSNPNWQNGNIHKLLCYNMYMTSCSVDQVSLSFHDPLSPY
jgi:hypothetical protein